MEAQAIRGLTEMEFVVALYPLESLWRLQNCVPTKIIDHHPGRANPTDSPEPIYYCGFADTAGAGDGYNFKKHRRLEDLERRRDLFGI